MDITETKIKHKNANKIEIATKNKPFFIKTPHI
jgi:hypothetical protein